MSRVTRGHERQRQTARSFGLAMAIFLTLVPMLAIIGFAACRILRGPLMRAEQDRRGLSDLQASVAAVRQELQAAQTHAGVLEATIKQLRPELKRREAELAAVNATIEALPAVEVEIMFEVGEASPDMVPFASPVARRGLTRSPGEAPNAEAALWARPRRVRVWADNPGSALAAARSRFPEIDGCSLRAIGG
jgi:hypothetical protein